MLGRLLALSILVFDGQVGTEVIGTVTGVRETPDGTAVDFTVSTIINAENACDSTWLDE